jgi:hypothetical protein
MLERGRVALVMAMTIGIVVTLASGCSKGNHKPPQEPQAAYGTKPSYPAPKFAAESVLTVSFHRIRAYADSLHFETTLGAADELPIDFERRRIGTERGSQTRIEPESTSYQLSEQELAQGRIIARLRSEAEVPKLGLGPRWTWWWVDQHGPEGSWRSVFISASEKPAYRIELTNSFQLLNHRAGYWHQAIARFWVVRETSPKGDPIWVESWGTCGSCCKQRLLVLAPE